MMTIRTDWGHRVRENCIFAVPCLMVEKSILRWGSTGEMAIIILGYDGLAMVIEKRTLAGLQPSDPCPRLPAPLQGVPSFHHPFAG
jgi:hypothetical protein